VEEGELEGEGGLEVGGGVPLCTCASGGVWESGVVDGGEEGGVEGGLLLVVGGVAVGGLVVGGLAEEEEEEWGEEVGGSGVGMPREARLVEGRLMEREWWEGLRASGGWEVLSF
jgi:hypothetical protein